MKNRVKKAGKWSKKIIFGSILFFLALYILFYTSDAPWLTAWIFYFFVFGIVPITPFYVLLRYFYLYFTKSKKLKKNSIAKIIEATKENGVPRVVRVLIYGFGIVIIGWSLYFSVPMHKHTFISLIYKDTSEKAVFTIADVKSMGGKARRIALNITVEEKEDVFVIYFRRIYHFKVGEKHFFHYLPDTGNVLDHYRIDDQGYRLDRYGDRVHLDE